MGQRKAGKRRSEAGLNALELTGSQANYQSGQQGGDNGVTRRKRFGAKPCEQHRAAQQAVTGQGGKSLQSKTQQDPGQHRGGQTVGDQFHQTRKQPGHAARHNQRRGENKDPDGFVQRAARQTGSQQRRAGCGPGGEYRRAIANRQRQGADPHSNAQRGHPPGDLFAGRASGSGGLPDNRGGTGVANQHGDKPGQQRGKGGFTHDDAPCAL